MNQAMNIIKNSLNTYLTKQNAAGCSLHVSYACVYICTPGASNSKFTNGHSGPGQAPFYEHTLLVETMNTITDVG